MPESFNSIKVQLSQRKKHARQKPHDLSIP